MAAAVVAMFMMVVLRTAVVLRKAVVHVRR